MTSINAPAPLPWTTVRNDDADAYEILDATEQVICSVPIGATKASIHRQQSVRDLVVASPILLGVVQQVLGHLSEAEPNLEECRVLLNRALSAARGQS